jgi:heavy metal translocating P-type ATPase
MASASSAKLRRSLEVELTLTQRFKIGGQLGSAMLAGCFLLVGVILQNWGAPEQRDVAELFKAFAAVVVVIPIFVVACFGVLIQDPETQSEQLVVLAALAALASADFVTASLIPIIMSVGHFLEERSVLGAQAAIAGLKVLQQQSANLITHDGEIEVDASTLTAGDEIYIRPGDVAPADGKIVSGASTVDQSSITGESTPEEVASGSTVFAGSVNLTGLLRVHVLKTGSQTAIGRVAALLADAEQSKTPVLKMIEKYAGYFILIVLTIAAVVLFATRDVSRAIAVLVVGCPGPFILAGPTAMVASLAAASRLGILVKNTRFLETLANVKTVILDKTGTVTLGQMQLVESRAMNGIGADDLLRQGARCASGSRHPVCRAIAEAAKHAGFEQPSHSHPIEELSGKGVIMHSAHSDFLLGKREWIIEQGISAPPDPDHSGSIVWLAEKETAVDANSRRIHGTFLLADQPRPGAKQAIAELRRIGVERCILLTGDRTRVADEIAEALSLDSAIAEVLPEQKLEIVHQEKNSGRLVMMVGDGVNDALALASGDVGVAMGAVGSDIALKSADVVLMANDLGRLPLAIELSRHTRKTMHQNVLIGVAISAVMLSMASSGIINPLTAAVLHNLGELFVIVNSARLLRFSAPDTFPGKAGSQ